MKKKGTRSIYEEENEQSTKKRSVETRRRISEIHSRVVQDKQNKNHLQFETGGEEKGNIYVKKFTFYKPLVLYIYTRTFCDYTKRDFGCRMSKEKINR